MSTNIETYDNGQMKSETNAKDGVPHGRCRAWHMNGQLAYEAFFKESMNHGSQKLWDERGNLSLDEYYRDGEIIDIPEGALSVEDTESSNTEVSP